jgi:hypothetical protein
MQQSTKTSDLAAMALAIGQSQIYHLLILNRLVAGEGARQEPLSSRRV